MLLKKKVRDISENDRYSDVLLFYVLYFSYGRLNKDRRRLSNKRAEETGHTTRLTLQILGWNEIFMLLLLAVRSSGMLGGNKSLLIPDVLACNR